MTKQDKELERKAKRLYEDVTYKRWGLADERIKARFRWAARRVLS